MVLLYLAIAFYVIAAVAGGLGYSGVVRSVAAFRIVFAVSLALAFIMIIIVGFTARAMPAAFQGVHLLLPSQR